LDFSRSSFVLLVALLATGCASTPSPNQAAGDAGSESANAPMVTESQAAKIGPNTVDTSDVAKKDSSKLIKEYRIGVDDVVQVSVWRNENLSVTVPVRPDGMISIPLAGDVLAGGLTPMQVADSIRSRLAAYVRDPRVTVILTQLHSHEYLSRVRVTGAVRNPISVSYRQGMTILDVVLAAGGVTEFASANGTRLYRKVGPRTEAHRVRLDDILKKGKLTTNMDILPGDVITVPERLF